MSNNNVVEINSGSLDLSQALQQFGSQYQPLEVSIDKNMYESFLSRYANADFLGKFINVCLYQSDFTAIAGISNNNEIIQYFKVFLKSLNEDIKAIKNTSINTPIKPFVDTINIINNILDVKDDPTARLMTYDTIDKHFQNLNPFTKQIMLNVSTLRIQNFQAFKSELEDINKLIQVYQELKQVKFISDEMDILKAEAANNDISALNLLKTYKEIIHKAYNVFSTLKSTSDDNESDKYLEFFDESSIADVTSKLLKYLTKSFNFYMSGYELLDKNIDGIESSSVYIVSAASNNGKSLFMINMVRNLINHQLNKFDPNDIILFITLEDDIYKLYRRIIAIFGNINPKIAKKLFVHCASQLKEAQNNIDMKNLEKDVLKLLEKITNKSVHKVTKGRCRLGLIHSNEFGYSMGDVGRFIDKKKVEGLNVKAVFIDYIDCMQVSNVIPGKDGGKEYDSQGQIVFMATL